nr:MAG TPA: FeoB-associated Cys-rich membrane protein [Microviridae sp.]
MKCLFLGFLPAGTEWIIITLFLFIIYFVIYKAIRNLFK